MVTEELEVENFRRRVLIDLEPGFSIPIATVKRCLDYLRQMPDVDEKRIAAAGHSFGGYMTTMATAVEPRIKVAVITGKYDCVTPFPFAEAAFRKTRRAYGLMGSADRVSRHVFAGDHVFRPDVALAWLDRWL